MCASRSRTRDRRRRPARRPGPTVRRWAPTGSSRPTRPSATSESTVRAVTVRLSAGGPHARCAAQAAARSRPRRSPSAQLRTVSPPTVTAASSAGGRSSLAGLRQQILDVGGHAAVKRRVRRPASSPGAPRHGTGALQPASVGTRAGLTEVDGDAVGRRVLDDDPDDPQPQVAGRPPAPPSRTGTPGRAARPRARRGRRRRRAARRPAGPAARSAGRTSASWSAAVRRLEGSPTGQGVERASAAAPGGGVGGDGEPAGRSRWDASILAPALVWIRLAIEE